METSLKVLLFLCFSSLVSCLQLFPSLNINAPLGLNIGVNSVKYRQPNENPFFSLNQCFCFPNTSDSQIVTKHLNLDDQGLERLVVYFYKSNGILEAFIPNKQKQIMIPDLSYDEVNGDTLNPVFQELAVDIFESSPSVVKKVELTEANEEEQANGDTLHKESDKDLNAAIIPLSDKEQETIDSDVENLTDEEGGSSLPQSDNNSLLDEHNMAPYGHDTSTEKHIPTPDDHTDLAVDSPQLPLETLEIKNVGSENVNNINNFNKLHDILSTLPQESRLYLQSLFPQLLYFNAENQKDYKDMTFDEWFKGQLSGIILQNLPTSANNELKQRIIEVLQSNGMRLSSDGKLFDSNGNLLMINNIKLRPILIGEPIETQFKVNHGSGNKYVTTTEMSYFQVILITLVYPPSLLGVVPVGKINIPRGLLTDPKNTLLNNLDEAGFRSALRFGPPGCKTCHFLGLNKILYPQLSGIPYFQLPLRKKFRSRNQLSKHKFTKELKPTQWPTLDILGNNVNKGSYENIVPRLLRLFGQSNNMFGDQSLRILGGKVLQSHKRGPYPYPNDDLPGFRIIGGKPAISSGTPLVSKGRSGFERPF